RSGSQPSLYRWTKGVPSLPTTPRRQETRTGESRKCRDVPGRGDGVESVGRRGRSVGAHGRAGAILGRTCNCTKPNQGVHNVKKYSPIIHILSLAFASLIAGCATNQPSAATAPPPNSGHVIVNRVANFGSNLSLVVSVDGKDVGSFTEGRNYD